jgi:hypothetical protein
MKNPLATSAGLIVYPKSATASKGAVIAKSRTTDLAKGVSVKISAATCAKNTIPNNTVITLVLGLGRNIIVNIAQGRKSIPAIFQVTNSATKGADSAIPAQNP